MFTWLGGKRHQKGIKDKERRKKNLFELCDILFEAHFTISSTKIPGI
jgi:hypothetical protein